MAKKIFYWVSFIVSIAVSVCASETLSLLLPEVDKVSLFLYTFVPWMAWLMTGVALTLMVVDE